jgi:hypothetical protein
MKPFRKALETLVNVYSKENGSDTPDFVLAEYLADSLRTFDKATLKREKWYGNEKQLDKMLELDKPLSIKKRKTK